MDAVKLLEFERECAKFFAIRRHKHSPNTDAGTSEAGHTGAWTRLGTGHYGEAWVHYAYHELVLKISGPAGWGNYTGPRYAAARGRLRPDAWPVYAEHCMNNPSKHLPKVYALHRESPRMTWGILKRYNESQWGAVYPGLSEVKQALYGEDDGPEWLWPLKQMVDGLGMTVDLHGGNIMEDDDGTWIITDPFSTVGTTPKF